MDVSGIYITYIDKYKVSKFDANDLFLTRGLVSLRHSPTDSVYSLFESMYGGFFCYSQLKAVYGIEFYVYGRDLGFIERMLVPIYGRS
ncbi:MAG: hypothetical protein Harvfovirus18_17 [Harvfovirus sp.]|uniref:Uncharacterized protein n=1 Tax=Harvfovirus sp. TaxID=2487768 RepID=A0A3G5A6R6_9VIRU|nr:MAG: hypothetical protein Harvfovirus18_17 [Harvfovirus sp.]